MLRHLLKAAAAMFVAALWSLTGIQAAGAAPRNILFIIADDMGVDMAPWVPTTDGRTNTVPAAAPTPILSALANQGVIFTGMWGYQECSPTRASIMTGRYAFRDNQHIGAWIDSTRPTPPLSADAFTIAKAFAAANAHLPVPYVVALVGKSHIGYEKKPYDLSERWGFPLYTTTVSGGALGNYYDVYNYVKASENNPAVTTVKSPGYATTTQVDAALGVIKSAKTQGRPYFLWLAFNAPHSPYQEPPTSLLNRPKSGTGNRAIFERMIEAMDTEIGRLLKGVDLSTTTVIFIGDNGTSKQVMASPYGAYGKSSPYGPGIEIPAFIAGAGVATPGRIYRGIVSGVDLYPTFLGLAGVSPASVVPPGVTLDGVSLVPVLDNSTTGEVHQNVYSEYFPAGNPNSGYTREITDPSGYKLIKRYTGAEEFFRIKGRNTSDGPNLLLGTLTTTQQRELAKLRSRMNALVTSH